MSGEQTLTAAERLRYLAGAGVAGQEDVSGETAVVRYHHDDLVGSTMLLSDPNGAPVTGQAGDGSVRYSAFGEPMDEDGVLGWGGLAETRYRYDGAWGYEAGPWGYAGQIDPPDPETYPNPPGGIVLYGGNPELRAITLVHVGARWYEPDVGRFVQRDPIGIDGGMTEYQYCAADPLSGVDSSGLDRWIVSSGTHEGIVVSNPEGGFVEIGIKMQVVGEGEPWWHLPKDFVQDAMNGALCVTVGGVGELVAGPAGNPDRPPDVISTPEQDRDFIIHFHNVQLVYYNLWWRNCRNWARNNINWGIM